MAANFTASAPDVNFGFEGFGTVRGETLNKKYM